MHLHDNNVSHQGLIDPKALDHTDYIDPAVTRPFLYFRLGNKYRANITLAVRLKINGANANNLALATAKSGWGCLAN